MKPAFLLRSPETQTDYAIFVEAPATFPGPLPVVLFMDGDDQFSDAVTAFHAARDAGEVRPLLLVGVGYGASYSRPANKRGRDYTPTAHRDEPGSGGAEAFARFLAGTLWPRLRELYPVSDDTRGIAGHSLGSLFALFALWREPLFFTHYLVSAPSLWWDDRQILDFAAQRHARRPGLPARMFLSIGEDDSASMRDDFALLEKQLAARPFRSLETTVRRFPGRDHFNVLPTAFRAGLGVLFPSLISPR